MWPHFLILSLITRRNRIYESLVKCIINIFLQFYLHFKALTQHINLKQHWHILPNLFVPVFKETLLLAF